MAEHLPALCKFPRWAWRYRNRIWICPVCEKLYYSKKVSCYDGYVRVWREWINGS